MSNPTGQLVLEQQHTRLTLDPLRGGVIRDLAWNGLQVLRPTPREAGDDPLDTACFPMVPYVNRIAHGRFELGRQAVRLAPNWSQDPHPLHGQGWRRPWTTLSHSSAAARLRFDGGGDEWPWPYRAEQHFQLSARGLVVELAIQNMGAEPMPAMLGLHPYFANAQQARLQAHLPRVWLTDGAALPVQEVLTPLSWRCEPARAVNSVPLDHGFAGWNGIAMVRWSNLTVTLRAPACGFLHVYAPAGRDFFCIEPQTAPPGALNRNPSAAANLLAPGARRALRVEWQMEAT